MTENQYNYLCGNVSDRCANPHPGWVAYHENEIQPILDAYEWQP